MMVFISCLVVGSISSFGSFTIHHGLYYHIYDSCLHRTDVFNMHKLLVVQLLPAAQFIVGLQYVLIYMSVLAGISYVLDISNPVGT